VIRALLGGVAGGAVFMGVLSLIANDFDEATAHFVAAIAIALLRPRERDEHPR